jgi:hypothetical protein
LSERKRQRKRGMFDNNGFFSLPEMVATKKCNLFKNVNQHKIVFTFALAPKLFERGKMHNSRIALCIKMVLL